jgi:GPI mannosyltransferase 3
MEQAAAPRIPAQSRSIGVVSPALIAGALVYFAAFALRLLPVFLFPAIAYPDEIFQAVEPAHRLVYGTGLVPWEFLYGTRSWALPGFIAGVMKAARVFGDGPAVYMPVIGTVCAALGAVSTLCAYLWGRRLYGLWGGIIAGALTACWIDGVYFGPRPLSEAVAAHLLVIGLYLAVPGYAVQGRARLALAGLVLGVVALLRIQLAPAVAFFVLWDWRDTTPPTRRLTPLIAGGAVAAILFGAIDVATWGWPGESLWRNVLINLWYGVSTHWGVQPWYYYVDTILAYWGAATAVMVVLARFGALRLPALAVVALVIFVVHSAVGHKEFRFIYPALLLTVISAGLGLAQVVDWIAGFALRGMAERAALRAAAVPVLLLAIITPAALAGSAEYRSQWTSDADVVRADRIIAALPDVCGIELYGVPWFLSGGYSLMHQNASLYWIDDAAGFTAHRDAFNAVLTARSLPANSGFITTHCIHDVCIAQRTGPCAALPMATPERPPGLDTVAPLVR